MTPLFSIIVPVFNRSRYAKTLMASLLHQECGDWEALFIDDGSEPGEKEQWRAQTQDARVRWLLREREPKGAPTCRNIGMENAAGEFVIFLDCDDALGGSGCLRERAEAMRKHPECDFVVSPTGVFRESPGDTGSVWNIRTSEPDLDRFLRRDVPWQTTSPTWRRMATEKLGRWDESLPGRQDWEWHVRALCRGLNYRRVAGGLSWWRETQPDSISGALSRKESLDSALEMLAYVGRIIEKSGVMTPRRRRLLAMQHIALGMTWSRHGQFGSARHALAAAAARGFLPPRLLKPLTAYAYSARVPLASKATQALLSPFVEQEYFVPWWTNQLRRPMAELVDWEG